MNVSYKMKDLIMKQVVPIIYIMCFPSARHKPSSPFFNHYIQKTYCLVIIYLYMHKHAAAFFFFIRLELKTYTSLVSSHSLRTVKERVSSRHDHPFQTKPNQQLASEASIIEQGM